MYNDLVEILLCQIGCLILYSLNGSSRYSFTLVSPTSSTLEQSVLDPFLPAMLVLHVQVRRLSKEIGVLNEDGVYSSNEIQIRDLQEVDFDKNHKIRTITIARTVKTVYFMKAF
jgi:hypothetical protein